jgi:hypothetical protein
MTPRPAAAALLDDDEPPPSGKIQIVINDTAA